VGGVCLADGRLIARRGGRCADVRWLVGWLVGWWLIDGRDSVDVVGRE
jgi:hypothetical protein